MENAEKSARKVVSEEDIKDYLVKKALRVARKLETSGDNNLKKTFVWKKKIERDVMTGIPLEEFSVTAQKRRRKEQMLEIQKLKKRREQRAAEKALREEEIIALQRERNKAQAEDFEKKEDVFHFKQSKIRSFNVDNVQASSTKLASNEEGTYRPRKPKYINLVHTGYEWNKYNKTHYDHDNPPPKTVQGYKFMIFYPDLVDKKTAPTYVTENDGDSVETCIIKFHAGPPYEDIAFQIVNREWEYSRKRGYKCTFEGGILHLHINFKRYGYRR